MIENLFTNIAVILFKLMFEFIGFYSGEILLFLISFGKKKSGGIIMLMKIPQNL